MVDAELFGHRLSGPFTIPSGIITTTADTISRFAREIPQLGILTTKSIGLTERKGNLEPVVSGTGDGGLLNCIGLSNPGAEAFAAELKEIYPLPQDKFLMVSIFGSNCEELLRIAREVEPYCDGIELNFSCPHAEAGLGASIGSSAGLSCYLTRAVKEAVSIPVFVKLPPLTSIAATALACVQGGADGIVAVNTYGPMESSHLSIGRGGLSGPPLLPHGVAAVKAIRETLRAASLEVPIIGVGGITDASSLQAYRDAGASFFGAGTALTGLTTDRVRCFFECLAQELEDTYCRSGEPDSPEALKKRISILTESKTFSVKKIHQITPSLRMIVLDGEMPGEPGQFVFLDLPGKGEKPLSLSGNAPVTLVIRKLGPFTSRIFELQEGDSVKVRGPYGKPFPLQHSPLCLVGGGTGLAPLLFAASRAKNPILYAGAKCASELSIIDLIGYRGDLKMSTEDGSRGFGGTIIEYLEHDLSSLGELSFIYCGPEPFLAKAFECMKKIEKAKALFLVERYMKCGIGICGSCSLGGLRTCVDGPWFETHELSALSGFGSFTRASSGRRIYPASCQPFVSPAE